MTDTITLPRKVAENLLIALRVWCPPSTVATFAAALAAPQPEQELEFGEDMPEPQPVKQADQSCRNCTFHYKDVDMPPCNSCTLGDHVGNNWEPMSVGQKQLANRGTKP